MMMHATSDDGVHDITYLSNNKFHRERPWVCFDTACESPYFSMTFDKFLIR